MLQFDQEHTDSTLAAQAAGLQEGNPHRHDNRCKPAQSTDKPKPDTPWLHGDAERFKRHVA